MLLFVSSAICWFNHFWNVIGELFVYEISNIKNKILLLLSVLLLSLQLPNNWIYLPLVIYLQDSYHYKLIFVTNICYVNIILFVCFPSFVQWHCCDHSSSSLSKDTTPFGTGIFVHEILPYQIKQRSIIT